MMNIIFKIQKYLKKHKNIIINIVMITAIGVSIFFGLKSCHYKSSYEGKVQKSQQYEEEFKTLENENGELEVSNQKLNETVQEQKQQIEAYEKQVEELQEQINNLEQEKKLLTSKLAAHVTYPDKDYMQATAVWNHLKSLGLNDYVCAGILGNIMAEVGGQTLDISRWSHYAQTNKNYYGICQWAGGRKTRLLNEFGSSLDAQIKFLGVELFEVIPENNSFYDMQDEKEAALYFAKYYERCRSSSYSVRQRNATTALNYFTGQ